MQEYYEKLAASPLFAGVSREEFARLSHCLAPRVGLFRKGEVIHRAGEPVGELGLILAGGIEAARLLPDGRSVLQAVMGPGEMFGEALASSTVRPSPVQVSARTLTRVLFLDPRQLISTCGSACRCHMRLIENLMRLLAEKYFAQGERLELLVRKGMREKLACYLLERRERAGADTFSLELDRREMADYLGVDRSAMSRELSRMKAEGLVDYYRGSFRLLDPAALTRASLPR